MSGRLIVRLLVLALIALLVWAVGGRQHTGPQPDSSPGTQVQAGLPPEAWQALALIRQGGPFPYAKDGTVFGNREGLLPTQRHGYYREYTVPTPGAANRGARRIIVGQGGEYYYSADHYQSFLRIPDDPVSRDARRAKPD